MIKHVLTLLVLSLSVLSLPAQSLTGDGFPRARTAHGTVEGTENSGIREFKGIPYATPPVGDLRWKPPQAPKPWKGIRITKAFGPRAMQEPIFGDMVFRSYGVSEDCLYLNVWTPANSAGEGLPVLVYFYGGGFMAGDGSEPRYDGEMMARRGIVTLTVNYRLNVFGFLSHPELSAESPHGASGNYGLLDQAAALAWVRENIAAFGGDPARVTIAGESAGSASVSAQMLSPRSRDLIAGAIGESGSVLGTLSAVPLAQGEQLGTELMEKTGAGSLAELRALPAEELLKHGNRYPVTVDGYFFPEDPRAIYEAGNQAQVPLLVGWNSQEGSYQWILGEEAPTVAHFEAAVRERYGDQAEAVLRVYAAENEDEVKEAGTALAGDNFIGLSTWRWADLHARTSEAPVYRYYYERPRPITRAELAAGGEHDGPAVPEGIGAVHSAEIEYAMGNLPTNRVFDWQPEDYKVSVILQGFFEHFIKTGDPNGLGLPHWPQVVGGEPAPVMHIDANTRVRVEEHRDRYLLLDRLSEQQ